MIVHARRASAILHRLLRGREGRGEFLIPANICPVVPATFDEAGVRFRLIDIEEASLEIGREACLEILGREPERIGGILFVRPYGYDRPVDSFFSELKRLREDLLIIDDKCLARPDCSGGGISPLADATLFSTGRAKHTDLGSGGFAHVRQGAHSELQGPSEECVNGWLDLRPHPLEWDDYRAEVIRAVKAADEQKRELNELYRSALPLEIQMPLEFSAWRFNIRVPRPDLLIRSIFGAGLFASRHYPVFASDGQRFPVAQRLAEEIVNLFNDRHFDRDRAERTAQIVNAHLRAV